MTGWLLIFCVLILGGILSTLGDRLGSRLGKARLSIFKLRPRKTAVLITILTGICISAISLGFMLLVSRQLRLGLFALEDIQKRLQESKLALVPLESKINQKEKELKFLEKNLYALRKGDVLISSGQLLFTKTIKVENAEDIDKEIESILQKANSYAFRIIKPGAKISKRHLLIRKDHVARLKEILRNKREWVVNIRSAANVFRGETYIPAFPEARLNKIIVSKGEIIDTTMISDGDFDSIEIRKKINLLILSTLAEVKKRGSLVSELEVNTNEINNIESTLMNERNGKFQINSISRFTSDLSGKISISLALVSQNKYLTN